MSSGNPASRACCVPGTQIVPADVAVVPPTCDDFSHSRTSSPCSAQMSAAVMPAAPAPAMRTSTSSVSAVMRAASGRLELDVLEIARPVVDADPRRRDPRRKLAGLTDRLHQRGDELAIGQRRQPLVLLLGPGRRVDQDAGRRRVNVLELADVAMKCHMRQRQTEVDAGPLDDLFEALDAL